MVIVYPWFSNTLDKTTKPYMYLFMWRIRMAFKISAALFLLICNEKCYGPPLRSCHEESTICVLGFEL